MFAQINFKLPGAINNKEMTFASLTITGNQSAYNSLFDSFVVYGNSFLNGVVTSKLNTLDDGTSAFTLSNSGSNTSAIGNTSGPSTLNISGIINLGTLGTDTNGINIATQGAKTLTIGNLSSTTNISGVVNVGSPSNGLTLYGSPIGIATGNSISSNVNIGTGTPYTGVIHIADGTGASGISIGNNAAPSATTILGQVTINNGGTAAINIGTGTYTGSVTIGGNSINITANSTGGVSIGNALNSIYIGSQGAANSVVNIQPGTGSNQTNICATSGYSGTVNFGNTSCPINIVSSNVAIAAPTNINTTGSQSTFIASSNATGQVVIGNITNNTNAVSINCFNQTVAVFSSGGNAPQIKIASGSILRCYLGYNTVNGVLLTNGNSANILYQSSGGFNDLSLRTTTNILDDGSSGTMTLGSTTACTTSSLGAFVLSNASLSIGRAGNSSVGAELNFGTTHTQRMICLYDGGIIGNQDQYQYYGFGVNPATLYYSVSGTGASHKFYAGTSSTTSNQLAQIDGNGNIAAATGIYAAVASGYNFNDGTGTGGTNYFKIYSSSSGGLVFQDLANGLKPMTIGTNDCLYRVGADFGYIVSNSYTTTTTITATDIVNGVIYIPSGTAAITLTFDTGTNLQNAFFPGGTTVYNNQSRNFMIVNQSSNTVTLATNSGLTLRLSKSTVAATTTAYFIVRNSATNAFQIFGGN